MDTLQSHMFRTKRFWHAFRQGLLMIVDAIERELEISPTTSEIRNLYKRSKQDADL